MQICRPAALKLSFGSLTPDQGSAHLVANWQKGLLQDQLSCHQVQAPNVKAYTIIAARVTLLSMSSDCASSKAWAVVA